MLHFTQTKQTLTQGIALSLSKELHGPGASDCAACVGVALEAARTIVQNPDLALPAPVTFLLNGGEEPILPAAHGFVTQSRFVKDLGAFINLESTGPGGPDIIFQYSGVPGAQKTRPGSRLQYAT